MDAKKCDRCGGYYDDNSKNETLFDDSEKFRTHAPGACDVGVCVENIYGVSSFHYFDLCPDCIAEFINWFEKDE